MMKPFRKIPLLLPLVLCAWIQVSAQVLTASTRAVSTKENSLKAQQQKPLIAILSDLGSRYKVGFSYDSQLLNQKNAEWNLDNSNMEKVEDVLEKLLPPLELTSEKLSENTYLILPAQKEAGDQPKARPVPQATQNKAALNISGRVTDENGDGLPGVTIVLKGTPIGATSRTNGDYNLEIPDGQENGTLVFSFIGYIAQEIPIANRATINIALVPDTKTLEEVVVVGYGTQKRANITGAVSSVSAQTFESRPVINVTQALQGAAPNLIIQQNTSEPGAGMNINIRGVGTLGNASPLVIVDGIPGSLDAINPNDIESISVLKDAASAAIYGSRAANGVLVVTTKKGTSNTKPRIAYNGLYGVQMPTFLQQPVSAVDYAQLKNEALANSGQSPQFSPAQIREFGERGSENWYLDEIFKSSAPQQNHNLSVSGGTQTTNYLFSLGYLKQESLFEGPGYNFNRGNARLSLTNQVSEKLRVGAIMAYAQTGVKEHAHTTEWIVADASRIPRIFPIRDTDGNFVVPASSSSNSLARLLEGGERNNNNDNIFGNINLEYELLKGFTLKGLVGANRWNYRTHEFRKSIDYSPYAGGDSENSVRERYSQSLHMNYQATANYENIFGKHGVQGLVGYSSEKFEDSFFQVRRTNIPGNDFGVINNGTVTDEGGIGGSGSEWALNSVFGRANYSFADKYLFETSFRYDGSSRFAADRRWSFFPSFSAGWRVTEEPFMSWILNTVNELKLRGSWGQLGNQNIGLYQYLSTVSLAPIVYSFNNEPVSGSYFNVANRNLTWETSTMTNLGVDVGFWGNKFSVEFDYFNKITDDILINIPVPGTFGAGSPTQNAAVVKNMGWELAATWRHAGKVNHTLTFNVADNLNTVVDTRGTIFGAGGGDRQAIIREGFPIRSYYGYRTNGFFQTMEDVANGPKPSFVANGAVQPGDIRYVDRNGDGIIDEQDRFVLGNPFPRYTFGANYSATWNGFDLLVFFQGVGKRNLYLRGEAVEAFHNNWDNVYEQHMDRWTPTNPNGTYPRLTIGTASTNNNAGSDFWLLDAAYVRLKNIQFGYSIPSTLTKKAGIERVRLYVTGQNLWTLTKMRNGFDPEITEFNSSLADADGKVHSGRVYPNIQTLAFGIDLHL